MAATIKSAWLGALPAVVSCLKRDPSAKRSSQLKVVDQVPFFLERILAGNLSDEGVDLAEDIIMALARSDSLTACALLSRFLEDGEQMSVNEGKTLRVIDSLRSERLRSRP